MSTPTSDANASAADDPSQTTLALPLTQISPLKPAQVSKVSWKKKGRGNLSRAVLRDSVSFSSLVAEP